MAVTFSRDTRTTLTLDLINPWLRMSAELTLHSTLHNSVLISCDSA